MFAGVPRYRRECGWNLCGGSGHGLIGLSTKTLRPIAPSGTWAACHHSPKSGWWELSREIEAAASLLKSQTSTTKSATCEIHAPQQTASLFDQLVSERELDIARRRNELRNQVGHRRIGRSPQAKWAEETGLLKDVAL